MSERVWYRPGHATQAFEPAVADNDEVRAEPVGGLEEESGRIAVSDVSVSVDPFRPQSRDGRSHLLPAIFNRLLGPRRAGHTRTSSRRNAFARGPFLSA